MGVRKKECVCVSALVGGFWSSLLIASIFSVHLEVMSLWRVRMRQEVLKFKRKGITSPAGIMGGKTNWELSASFKDPLESHGNDCDWHEWAFVYAFLQLSLIILVQAQRKWRTAFIQDWGLARESQWRKRREGTWASLQRAMESKLGMVGKWGKGKSKCWNQCFTAACGVRWLFESCHKSDKAAQRGNVVWEDDTWNEDYGDDEVQDIA